MMQNFIGKLERNLINRQANFEQATVQDVYFCYRLLLNREPDQDGWEYWSSLVESHHISLATLCDGFLGSHEFKVLLEERNRPQLIELPDFKMYVRLNDHFVGAVIANEKAYEPYVTAEFHRLLQPGMTFVDIGANIGYFTMLAARLVGETGLVYAFEPRPANCGLLQQSADANGFDNITLYPNAVAEKAQTLIFSSGGADSNGRIINEWEPVAKETTLPRVEAIVLDEVLADVDKIDVIKMDIEGAEPRAWQGMQKLIAKHRPVLVTEFGPEMIRTTSGADPVAYLNEMQQVYDIYILERDGQKSATPLSTDKIMNLQATTGMSHVDLVAYPKAG